MGVEIKKQVSIGQNANRAESMAGVLGIILPPIVVLVSKSNKVGNDRMYTPTVVHVGTYFMLVLRSQVYFQMHETQEPFFRTLAHKDVFLST